MYTQFIGKDILLPRKNLIHEINEVFEKQSGIKYAILVGEGGMGKTVISRHYLQLNDFKIKAEINAETYNSLSDSFANLAITLANTKELQERLSYIRAITDCKRRNKQVFLFVLSQLREVGNWCLLFDNVDDFNLIQDFIPINDGTYNNGKVIITTRNENFKNVTIFPRFCAINVPLLTVNEQEELFSKITCGKDKRNEAVQQSVLKNFLKNIPSMPLDVCAAAFYIKNTRISFGEYLKLSKNPCQSIEKIQSNFLAEGINYDKTRYGIISSVFEKIIKTNADFKELLLFICLLDSQNIPKAYLEKCKDHAVVQDFIHNLRKYSLITEKNGTFSIHRSTQEIGLKYILSRLSEDEKIQFLDNIIRIMTPYEDIWWLWSKNPKEKLGALDRKKLLLHLEFLLEKLSKVSPSNKLEEYNVKILLAILYCYEDIKSYRYMQQRADEIISLNSASNYLDKFDLAVLLLENVYLCFNAGYGDISKKHIEECLKLCEQSPGFENVEANCLSYKGRYYLSYGDKQRGLFFLKHALEMLKKVNNSCIMTTTAHVYRQYSYCICNHYINKKEVYDAIAHLLEVLKLLNASVFFHRNPEQFRDNLFLVPALRLYLANAYNSVGAYDEALECEREVYFLYDKLKEKGVDLVSRRAILGITNSLTLLRKERIQEAYDMLTQSIDTAIRIGNSIDLFFGLVYRSEACIRLGKLDEAYSDCIKAEQFLERTDFNYNKLINCTRYYNMGIVRYKQDRSSEASKYFQKFLELANVFCRDFLKKEQYEKLVFDKAFKITRNEAPIKTYLQNSLKIFTAIYGEKHPFIENYVKKTLSKP